MTKTLCNIIARVAAIVLIYSFIWAAEDGCLVNVVITFISMLALFFFAIMAVNDDAGK